MQNSDHCVKYEVTSCSHKVDNLCERVINGNENKNLLLYMKFKGGNLIVRYTASRETVNIQHGGKILVFVLCHSLSHHFFYRMLHQLNRRSRKEKNTSVKIEILVLDP